MVESPLWDNPSVLSIRAGPAWWKSVAPSQEADLHGGGLMEVASPEAGVSERQRSVSLLQGLGLGPGVRDQDTSGVRSPWWTCREPVTVLCAMGGCFGVACTGQVCLGAAVGQPCQGAEWQAAAAVCAEWPWPELHCCLLSTGVPRAEPSVPSPKAATPSPTPLCMSLPAKPPVRPRETCPGWAARPGYAGSVPAEQSQQLLGRPEPGTAMSQPRACRSLLGPGLPGGGGDWGMQGTPARVCNWLRA